MGRQMHITAVAVALLALPLTACATNQKARWTGTGESKFVNAQRSCDEQTLQVADAANRRAFFIGCMGALGWTPGPTAVIDY